MPAGNLKKLKTAFHFGADAVYIGGKSLSLRAFADNFSDDELAEGVKFAHSIGKKVYVTANIYAKNTDLAYADKHFAFLSDIGADGVLVSDMGLFCIAKRYPSLKIHISTQANTQNSEAVKFWRDMGASRVVLARELSIDEIAEIHAAVPEMELEAFVHGAMCMSMSGRCLLSSYFTGRDANRGECAQPCRWKYRLVNSDSDEPVAADIEQDERGSYLLNSKDLRLLNRLPELIEAGVCSFKVEGRMKSELYIATVANAYRRALVEYLTCGKIQNADAYNAMLEEVSHREYTEAFFDGQNLDSLSLKESKTRETAIFVATVIAYDGQTATVEMRNRFFAGDTLTVISNGPTDRESFTATDIALDGSPVDDAKLVQSVYTLRCPIPLAPGDILVRMERA